MFLIALSIGLLALLGFVVVVAIKEVRRARLPSGRTAIPIMKQPDELRPVVTGATFNPIAGRAGGCLTCRYFRPTSGLPGRCVRPGIEGVPSQPDRGCAFWECEPGADCEATDLAPESAVSTRATA